MILRRIGLAVSLGAAVALAGCVSAQFKMPQSKIGKNVQFGAQTTASVGGPILSEFDYAAVDGAIIKDSVETTHVNQRIRVPAGMALIASTLQGRPAYCTNGPGVYTVLGVPMAVACFFDRNNDGLFEAVIATGDSWGEGEIPPARYTKTDIVSGPGFKYELLYEGVSGNTMNVSYREFSDNMARPAFQQDLHYTLNPTGQTDISFRGARITVTKADNNGVSYVAHSGVRR